LSLTLGKVFFPLYASIRADNVALRAAFTTALYLLGIIMLPATLGLLVVVPDALAGIFGEKWVAAGPLVRILALYGACRTLALASNDAGAATGRPDMLLAVEMIAVTVALLLLWPLAAWGAAGVAWAFTLGQGAAAAYGGWHTRRLWNGAVVRQLRAPALAAAVATLAGVFAARVASGFLEGWLALATLVVVYLVALMMADRQIVGIVSLLLGRGGAAHESAR
jgi:O-antigen/teichoic acid export membrane protein